MACGEELASGATSQLCELRLVILLIWALVCFRVKWG